MAANTWTLVNGITYKGYVFSAGTRISDANFDVVDMRTKGAKFVEDSLLYDPASLAPTAWIIDGVGGDDRAANGGRVKTFGEIKRRWGQAPRITAAVTIAQVGDLLPTDRYDFSGVTNSTHGSVTVDGSSSVVVASELAGLASANNISLAAAGGDCAQYVTIAGQNWATLLKKMVRRKSDGAIGYISKDMISGKARTTPFVLNPTFNSGNVDLAAGDVLQVLTLPKANNVVVPTVNASISFKNLQFNDQDGSGHDFTGQGFSGSVLTACDIVGFFFFTQNLDLFHCQLQGFCFGQGSPTAIICGGHFCGGANNFQMPSLSIDNHALFANGTNIRMFGGGGSLMSSVGKVGFYDVVATAGAVVAAQAAVCLFGNSLSGTSCIYGAASYNAEARSYGRLFYDSSQGEANIFKVAFTTAKFKQGAVGQAGPLPLAPDASLNSIVAWT